MRQPDRDFILAGQSEHTADVVTMLVRHDDAVEIARLATYARSRRVTAPATPKPQSSISGFTGLDE